MNIPGWVKIVLWIAFLLIVLALLKFSFHAGPEGIGVSQGLVN